MDNKLFLKSRKAGQSPGTLPETNPHSIIHPININVIDFKGEEFEERNLDNVSECLRYRNNDHITWIDVEGTDQTEEIEKLGTVFGLHPLLIEDIIDADQRPKIDDYENHIFITLTMLAYNDQNKEIKSEQISFVLGDNYVLSFQEIGKEGDIFDPNRNRIRNNKGKIRKHGADYLLYTLIDTVVDNYFIILEKTGERIEDLEACLIKDPTPENLKELYKLKREMIFLRKSVWPLREVINKLERDEIELIQPSTIVYIKDVYDHTVQVMDTIDSYREILGGIMDIYLSSTGNKMNSVMKVLTLISTIFMPLTFIVGVYGMNFDNMPELKSPYGYFEVLLVCIILAIGMILFFKKKKWL